MSLTSALINKLKGTTVVDNKSNPASANSMLRRKLNSGGTYKGNIHSRPVEKTVGSVGKRLPTQKFVADKAVLPLRAKPK